MPTRCCIAGGGPAGMMLGYLLARSGIDTVVLEKHADFLRDFRGDTVHPSTMEVIHELGLLEDFLSRPHSKVGKIGGLIAGVPVVVAADGRDSTLRAQAGLAVTDFGAPMDVLWLRLSKQPEDPVATLGRIDRGRVFVTLDRGDYWQCAFVIPKGANEQVRARGLGAFRADIAAIAPFLRERTTEIRGWDDVKLLSVQVNRLERWHAPGFLCIGDAAHAMSPIAGVGINLAIQDAVAAANILVPAFLRGQVVEKDLAAVQRRRDWPTRMTQRMQLLMQNRIIRRVLAGQSAPGIAWPIRLMQAWPLLQRIPARFLGLGFRPEHIAAPSSR